MPRLLPSLIRRAYSESPHLAPLLSVCRDIASARNELRWIRQHVVGIHKSRGRLAVSSVIGRLCKTRGRGVPLQYVLGSQPFGRIDVLCRPGVLIPRPETEAWVYHLGELICKPYRPREGGQIHILDFCTGTGCIALLLASRLRRKHFTEVKAFGCDISPKAVALARRNFLLNSRLKQVPGTSRIDEPAVEFLQEDIFQDGWRKTLRQRGRERIDILVSNPPYISAEGFNKDTSRSVRRFEPKLALVPDERLSSLFPRAALEDVFYARLLEIGRVLCPRMAVFEVGDMNQAVRVVEMAATSRDWSHIEIWRDWPNSTPEPGEREMMWIRNRKVPVRGSGHGRAVFLRE
ncbi:release factor glutamine methyltransferase [Microdochium nivale]|nr:release factor glutamine methyltransferase [Microdochium nivale]